MRRHAARVLAAAAAIAAMTLVVWALRPIAPDVSLGALYTVVVLAAAVAWGLPYALAVSIASLLVFNFFFLPPVHTLSLAQTADWTALVVYLVTGIVASELATSARRRAREAERRERDAALLADLAARLLERGDVGELAARVEAADDASGDRLRDAVAALVAISDERRRLEREALEAEALRRADAVKTAVLQSVSHDLRTPLATIVASLDGLGQGAGRDEVGRRELVDAIRHEVARLERFVENLLDLSRLQAGAAAPASELWTVDALAALALDELEEGDRVRLDLPTDLPPVLVDAAQIVAHAREPARERAQVLAARRAAVTLSAGAGDHEVALRVEDEGPGVPSAEADGDLRAVPARARKRRRRARARDRARVRDGERRPAVGRAARDRPRVRVRARAARGRGARCGAIVSGRLLVVDDEPQFLRALAANLRGAGYAVETADTAAGALAVAERVRPDAIVLDLVLPDGRGTDVCRRLRLRTAVPIVLISAVGDEAEKVAALDAGADDYVTKPFGLGELLARLRAVRRRAEPARGPVLRVGPLEIDRDARTVRRSGELLRLTPHEFDVLRVLGEHEGTLMTHAAILREVWGTAYQRESSYLHVYVSQLRRKIEHDPARPRLLLTDPGTGYRLVAGEP